MEQDNGLIVEYFKGEISFSKTTVYPQQLHLDDCCQHSWKGSLSREIWLNSMMG